MRINNLEFRRNREGRSPEIVKWCVNNTGAEHCFTLLWYIKYEEGWQIQFVGPRPLYEAEPVELFELMRYGQTVLDAETKLMERTS